MGKKPWPQEHIESLSVMWRDGLTATEIAGALPQNPATGYKYTRNAVIGCIYRMREKPEWANKFTRRVKRAPGAPKSTAKKKQNRRIWPNAHAVALQAFVAAGKTAAAIAKELPDNPQSKAPYTTKQVTNKVGALGLSLKKARMGSKVARVPQPAIPTQPRKAATPAAPTPTMPAVPAIRMDELTDTTCRWPIGDPRDPSFGYCGAECAREKAYCDEHAEIAYVPLSGRRRKTRAVVPIVRLS